MKKLTSADTLAKSTLKYLLIEQKILPADKVFLCYTLMLETRQNEEFFFTNAHQNSNVYL